MQIDPETIDTLQLTRRQVLEVTAAISAGVTLGSLDVFRSRSAAAAGQMTLTFFGQTGGTNTGREIAHRAIFKNFSKLHSDVAVNAQFFPWDELQRKLAISVASSSPPDIVYVDGPIIPEYVHAGVLQPIEHIYSKAELDDIVPPSLAEATVNGHFYGPAESESSMALFYNKTMTDKHGVKLPQRLNEAWTWPKVLNLLRELTVVSGGRTQVYGLERVQAPGWYGDATFVRSQGRNRQDPTFLALSKDGLTAHGYLDTAEAIAGFQFFQDLFVKYKVAPTVPVQEMLATGRAAMSVGSENEITDFQRNYPNLEWGIMPLPYFRTPMCHTGSLHYAVAAKTKHPDMAAQLAKFMGNSQSSLIMFKYLGQVPALKSVFALAKVYDTYPRKLFQDTLLQWGVIRPKTVGYNEYETGIDTALSDMTSGVSDVAARVRSMVTSIDTQLAKYR